MKVKLVEYIVSTTGVYSLGGGVHNGIHNFSRRPFYDDKTIPIIGEQGVVHINKFGVDIYLGLLPMAGKELPELDYNTLSRLAFNGIFECYMDIDPYDETLLYAVGVEKLAEDLGIPKSVVEDIDISSIVDEMMKKTFQDFVEIGRKVNNKRESAFTSCLIEENLRAGCWSITEEHEPFNHQKLLLDEYDIVVVYREHKQSVSIYYNDKIDIDINKHMIMGGIEFSGGDGAVHSPKGVLIDLDQLDDICSCVLYEHRFEK